MDTNQLVEDRVGAVSRRAVPVPGRVPAQRPVVRDRRGPAGPPRVRVRGAVACPSAVPRSRALPASEGMLRRLAAGVGLVLASAAAVVGLGLLADASAASVAPSAPVGVLR